MCSIVLLLLCAVVGALSEPAIKIMQCGPNDDECVTKAAQEAYSLILNTNEAIGAKNLDPMFVNVIEGNLSILKFKLYNTTVKGFKECKVNSAKFEAEKLTYHVDVSCPSFQLSGQYDIDGRLIVLPVQGSGDYKLNAETYSIIIDAELKITPGDNGKKYLTVKNFKIKPKPLGRLEYDFKNLFNGNKELSDAVHKFANENYEEVALLVQQPVFTETAKELVKNANKYLKTIPISEFLNLYPQLM